MNTERKVHWDNIYQTKPVDAVSWYQQKPDKSLQIIEKFMPSTTHPTMIDVGGGASTLVDYLLADGYDSLVILDIAEPALAKAKERLGDAAQKVSWVVADITNTEMPANRYDLWHDRAVFHFLVTPEEQASYVRLVNKTLKAGGILVMSTFAPDGPEKCSNLTVRRYDCDDIWQILYVFGHPYSPAYDDVLRVLLTAGANVNAVTSPGVRTEAVTHSKTVRLRQAGVAAA